MSSHLTDDEIFYKLALTNTITLESIFERESLDY